MLQACDVIVRHRDEAPPRGFQPLEHPVAAYRVGDVRVDSAHRLDRGVEIVEQRIYRTHVRMISRATDTIAGPDGVCG